MTILGQILLFQAALCAMPGLTVILWALASRLARRINPPTR